MDLQVGFAGSGALRKIGALWLLRIGQRMTGSFNLIPYQISILAIPATIAITFHEVSHGYLAHLLGDDTAGVLVESASTRWSLRTWSLAIPVRVIPNFLAATDVIEPGSIG
jgi:hypothetical protein